MSYCLIEPPNKHGQLAWELTLRAPQSLLPLAPCCSPEPRPSASPASLSLPPSLSESLPPLPSVQPGPAVPVGAAEAACIRPPSLKRAQKCVTSPTSAIRSSRSASMTAEISPSLYLQVRHLIVLVRATTATRARTEQPRPLGRIIVSVGPHLVQFSEPLEVTL